MQGRESLRVCDARISFERRALSAPPVSVHLFHYRVPQKLKAGSARVTGKPYLIGLGKVCRRSTRDRKIRTQQPVFYSNGGAPSVDGEFCAVNETGAIRRQEDDGLGNLVRCSWTARRRQRGQLLNTLPQGIGALRACRSRAYCINADTARAIFSRPRLVLRYLF